MNLLDEGNDRHAKTLMRSDLPVNCIVLAVTTVGRGVLALAVSVRPAVLERDDVAVAVRIF